MAPYRLSGCSRCWSCSPALLRRHRCCCCARRTDKGSLVLMQQKANRRDQTHVQEERPHWRPEARPSHPPKPLCTQRFVCRSVMNHLKMRNLHAVPDAAQLCGFLLSGLNQLPKVFITNRVASPLPNLGCPVAQFASEEALWTLSRFRYELILEEVQSEQWVLVTFGSALGVAGVGGQDRPALSTRNTNHTDKILSVVLLSPPPVSLHRLFQTPPFVLQQKKKPPLKTI